jgi:alpha-1,6-mannosyltransferase
MIRNVIGAAQALAPARGRLVVADVALMYGERGGGIRTYLDEKARFAAASGAFEHHVVVPGRRVRHQGGRHELRAVRLAASNGYRVPLGAGGVKETLRSIRPHVVLIHDPFWRSRGVTAEAHRLGAKVIAVHHASPAMNAAGLPGPDAVYVPFFRRVYRHAYEHVDAVMSVVDPLGDSGRRATLPLRLGLHPAFRPAPAIRRDHVLYAGRLAWEKGVFDLLEAAAISRDRWPLWLVGDGPAKRGIRARIERLGLGRRVSIMSFVRDRHELARLYREAACVVMPGPHETFGLVALEAAASGGRVAASMSAPSTRLLGSMVKTFAPGDAIGMARAIDRARQSDAGSAAAAALAERFAWPRVFEAELSDVLRLVR